MTTIDRVFTVRGEPFFPIGGQARNSSGYNAAEAETAFRALKLINGNTLEIPVYWEQIEPEEGVFDFQSVDALLECARRDGVRLVLLWFATWKNGSMDYTPAWVKTDPGRFKRVTAPTGRSIWVLSSHCQATLDADQRAFTELCAYLKAHDGAERTVIALQIENEPGILGSDRDHGPEAQACYHGPVPAELVERMRANGQGRVYDLWQQAGGAEAGTWPELFGWSAGEVMTSWSIASYIDCIAKGGKEVYDIPMYTNAWLGEREWALAGESYPSGGPISAVLDIYKWFAPHLDLIAPDIYIPDSRGYEAICAAYARDDNPLFVPESAPGGSNAWNMFRAIADYGAIGYAFFAIERIIAADGSVRPEHQPLVDSFCAVALAIPLLLRYQGTGKVHAVIQEENQREQLLDLDGWLGLVEYDDGSTRRPKDWRHRPGEHRPEDRGRGLVIQASRQELYFLGASYRVMLRPKLPPDQARDASLANGFLCKHQVPFIHIDEGHLDERGAFIVDRRRNGDEANHGVWVEADVGVVRVLLCDP